MPANPRELIKPDLPQTATIPRAATVVGTTSAIKLVDKTNLTSH